MKPFLRGRDVKRWVVNFADLWLLFIPWHFPLHEDSTIVGVSVKAEEEFRKQYPAIYKHLSQYKEQLLSMTKAETGIRYEWYALQRCAATYYKEFEETKIVYPNICKRNEFTWDQNNYYINQKAFIIPTDSKYLLGVLNSSVFMWLFTQLLAKLQNDFYEPSKIFMKEFPIPKPTDTQDACVTRIVDQIMEIKRQNPKADTTKLEREIDEIVYKLYGLTEKEIRIIEESVKQK